MARKASVMLLALLACDGLMGQDATPLVKDEIVVEAERFQFMTYGWQIGEGSDASGGRCLHIKEGVGGFDGRRLRRGNWAGRSGDFYNVTRDNRPIEARCYFMAPQAGIYFVAVRTMAHRESCSNIIRIGFNGASARKVGRNGTTPFVWLWHKAGRIRLEGGLNYLSLMTYQDDVKVDQIVLSKEPLPVGERSPKTFTGGFSKPLPVDARIRPANLSLSADTLAITDKGDPEIVMYVGKNVSGDINASLRVSFDHPDRDKREKTYNIELPDSPGLISLPCEIDLPRPLERKEYLLRVGLCAGSKLVEERTLVLSRGYDWSILGPVPYIGVAEWGPVEPDEVPKKQYQIGVLKCKWHKYKDEFTEQFSLLDFGRMFSGKTMRAMHRVAVYAYTEVETEKAGRYLLKVQGDDNITVWINGRRVVTISEKGPAIRTAREIGVPLAEGRNRILFRLNQNKDQWQAGIRVRTADDKVADVKGIPFAEQDVDFYR